ncbi:MAG: hypothetical protein KGL42_01105 [Betaproteobacteria bacterium]|nr:hypothetical protein [Betaproteobacteria bacterium]
MRIAVATDNFELELLASTAFEGAQADPLSLIPSPDPLAGGAGGHSMAC